MKTLILCPLPLELKFILERFKEQNYQFKRSEIGPLSIYESAELGLRLSLAGHGKVQFGIQAQFLLGHFAETQTVICTGCAGSLSTDIANGDVVIATKTIEHDFKSSFSNYSLPEFLCSKDDIEQIKKIETSGFLLHFGPIASGDEDILTSQRAKELAAQTNAIAVAWEGAGGARAASFNKLAFLELRGITDNADSQGLSNFKAKLKIAMSNVTDILLKLSVGAK